MFLSLLADGGCFDVAEFGVKINDGNYVASYFFKSMSVVELVENASRTTTLSRTLVFL